MPTTPEKETTHWIMGEDIAYRFIIAETQEEKAAIAEYCEGQGILAGIACFHLYGVSYDRAKEFIQFMIASVEEKEP
jgi:hypothetical protein